MRRVLLTGATGFIGGPVLRILISKGFEVHAVSSRQIAAGEAGVSYHQANLLCREQIQALVKRVQPTHLLHLAWNVHYSSPQNFDWVRAGFELVRAFQEHGGERVVLAGTCYEYDALSGYCTEGHTPVEPHTTYAKCKDILRQWVDTYAETAELSVAWARIFFTYGPNEAPRRLVPSVIRSLLDGQPAQCSHGEQVRDYMHVYDVASACSSLLHSETEGAVNIASGMPVRLKDIIGIIARELDRAELVQLGAIEPGHTEPDLLVANTTRLREEIGWSPLFTLEAGLKHTINWWKREYTESKTHEK